MHGPGRPHKVYQTFCSKWKPTSMFNEVLLSLSGWNSCWTWSDYLKTLCFLLLKIFALKQTFKIWLFLIMKLSMKYMKNELSTWAIPYLMLRPVVPGYNEWNNLLVEFCLFVTFYWKHIKYTTSRFCYTELFKNRSMFLCHFFPECP